MTTWAELDDAYPGMAIETSYTDTAFAATPTPGKRRVFYRVTRNP